MKKILSLIVLSAMISTFAFAVTTRVLEINSVNDFIAGNSQWVEISGLGKIRPGAALQKYKTGEQQIWSILAHSSGKYFIATGLHGQVMMFDKDKIAPSFKTESIVVSALVEGANGKIYAATAPGGWIYEINADGSGGKKFCKVDDDYVWSLAIGKDGTLYAGTGPKGIIFSIGKDAAPKKIVDLKNDQVIRLAVTPSGKLVAGTAKKGALYLIDPSNNYSYSIIASFSNLEIAGLAVASNGSLIIGLNSLKIKAQPPQLVRSQDEDPDKKDENPQSSDEGGQAQSSQEAVAQAKCAVARVSEKGVVDLLYQQNRMFITDLVVQNDGKIFFTTGPDGRIFSISTENEVSLINDLPESQASTLSIRNGVLAAIGTANPGNFYLFDKGVSQEAKFTSKTLDVGLPSDWGRVQLEATGNGVAIETRSGNIETPDNTWSAWREVGGADAQIQSPSARYLQIRVTWKNSNAEIRSIRVYYRPVNQQPLIVEAAVIGSDQASDGGGQSNPPPQPGPQNTQNQSDKVMKVVKWTVRNPDNDKLTYWVEFRKEGDDYWVPINTTPLEKNTLKWDTTDIPDGWYRVRIIASDDLSNPPGMSKKSQWITEPFLIDNTKPAVKNLEARGNMITGLAIDDFSVIKSISYSLDGADWVTVWPEDGFFDQTTEKIKITLEGLKPGKHNILISVSDEGGNSGSGSITFDMK